MGSEGMDSEGMDSKWGWWGPGQGASPRRMQAHLLEAAKEVRPFVLGESLPVGAGEVGEANIEGGFC